MLAIKVLLQDLPHLLILPVNTVELQAALPLLPATITRLERPVSTFNIGLRYL
jgi:hypothetical protein